jgi:hypothetical protein
MEELLYEQLLTPEEREAEEAEHEAVRQEREAQAAERARREAVWKRRHPSEWAEWVRLQPLLNPLADLWADHRFDFDEFLKEVGRRTSPEHVVAQSDDAKPYQQGNLTWAAPALEPLGSPYLDLKQAAAFLGVSPRTVYNNRKYIPSLPGFRRPLMFDPKVLEEVRASAKFRSKRTLGQRRKTRHDHTLYAASAGGRG